MDSNRRRKVDEKRFMQRWAVVRQCGDKMPGTSLAKNDKLAGFSDHAVRDAIKQLCSVFDVSKPYKTLPKSKDYSGKGNAKQALGGKFEDYSPLPAICLKCHRIGNKWLQSICTLASSSSDLNVLDRVTAHTSNATKTPKGEQHSDDLDVYAFDNEPEDPIDEAILEIDETAAEIVQAPTAIRPTSPHNDLGATVRRTVVPKADVDRRPHLDTLTDILAGRLETPKAHSNVVAQKRKSTPYGRRIGEHGNYVSSGLTYSKQKLVPNSSQASHCKKEMEPLTKPRNTWEERSTSSKKPKLPLADVLDDDEEDDFFLQQIDLS